MNAGQAVSRIANRNRRLPTEYRPRDDGRKERSWGALRPMRILRRSLLVLAMAASSLQAHAQAPSLRYDPPAGFTRSAVSPPDRWVSREVNADIAVYEMRPARGDVLRQFQLNLLRDWVEAQSREQSVVLAPRFQELQVRGAERAVMAFFGEGAAYGRYRPRLRVLVIAAGSAALLDVATVAPETWERIAPSVNAMLGSLRVQAGGARPSVGAAVPGSDAVMGIYRGWASSVGVGGRMVEGVQFYLFTADGRVYRAFHAAEVPADIGQFDFEAAALRVPWNAGRYRVNGEQLRIEIGERFEEVMVTRLPANRRLLINGRLFERQ